MNNEFARMLQAAIPTIVTEVRRTSEENNAIGNGSGIRTGGGGHEDHVEQPVRVEPR